MRHLRDDFWAETSTETLHELLESQHVFDTPEPELFASTINAELARRGEQLRPQLRVVRATPEGSA